MTRGRVKIEEFRQIYSNSSRTEGKVVKWFAHQNQLSKMSSFDLEQSEADISVNDNNENDVSNIAENTLDSQEESDSVPQPEEELKEKLVRLPLTRVRTIVKMDSDVNLVNQEAIFLITKSTELFIESMAREAYKYTSQSKKKTVQKQDVQSVIDNVDSLAFLEGAMWKFIPFPFFVLINNYSLWDSRVSITSVKSEIKENQVLCTKFIRMLWTLLIAWVTEREENQSWSFSSFHPIEQPFECSYINEGTIEWCTLFELEWCK